MSEKERILEPGRNCWRVEACSRLRVLVDGAAYFDAFAGAVERAERSVVIIGWDIHSRTVLRPDRGSEELAPFLHRMLDRRPELHVFLLEWDFSVLFALDRDWTPVFRRGEWIEHRRLDFRFDDQHPWGASQHQKIVVVDDALAFVGGLDLTVARWDTTDHDRHDPRRRLPNGEPYPPFHDVQVMVDGAAARALGELARERWRRATGRCLSTEETAASDPWPEGYEPDLEDVSVAIARTQATEGGEAIREVERLYLDAIAASRRLVYVENQYFTSPKIAAALEERLGEEDGPEIVIVLPRACHGWLEENTMGALRARLLEGLRRADVHGRLRAVYPAVGRDEETAVNVHAKVLVIDDRLVRIGSSNLSNRSMGFDSECDVALESERSGDHVARAIRRFRHRLVAEHLGWREEELEDRVEDAEGSLLAVLDGAERRSRNLVPLASEPSEWEVVVPDQRLVDPDSPETPGRAAEEFVSEDIPEATRGPWIRASVVLAGLLALAAAWRWTPLSEWVQPESLAEIAETLRGHPLAPLIVVVLYVVGSVLMLPITGLILATALTFDPWQAIGYSMLGSLTAAVAGFAIGHLLARDTVRRLAGSRLNRVSQLLARRGIIAVVALRNLPAGPFTITNIVAGASHIGWRDFTVGSAVGLAPGILAVNLFKSQVEHAIRDPGWDSVLLAGGVLVTIVLVLAWTRRLLKNNIDNDDA